MSYVDFLLGRPTCKHHEYEFDRHCGVKVCIHCDDHLGLVRCFCGWSKTRPGQGREALTELGETIDDD